MPKTIKRNRRAGIRSRKIHQRGGIWPWSKKSKKSIQEYVQPLLPESGANPEYNPDINPNPYNTHANVSQDEEAHENHGPEYLEISPQSQKTAAENNKSIIDYPYMVVSENNVKTYKDPNNNLHYYLGTEDKRVIITENNTIIPVYKYTDGNDNFYLVETKLYNETVTYYTKIKQTFSKKTSKFFFKKLTIAAIALWLGGAVVIGLAGTIVFPLGAAMTLTGGLMGATRMVRYSIYKSKDYKFNKLNQKFINDVINKIDDSSLTNIKNGLDETLKFNNEIIEYETTKIDVKTRQSIKRFLNRLSGGRNERRNKKYGSRLRRAHSNLTKKENAKTTFESKA